MASKKRRKRRHRGVVLMKPNASARTGWRARYVDPESPPDAPRFKYESLPVELTTAEQREAWAVKKSRTLDMRRTEIHLGAPRGTGSTLEAAIKHYYDDHPRLRDRTLEVYRCATNKLLVYAKRAQLDSADDLNRAKLMKLRARILHEPKKVAAEGERGTYEPTDEPRSAGAINRDLRALRTVLGYLRKLELLPRLTTDDLRDALKQETVTHELVEYLRPHELQKLLEAALRHDADLHKITREENRGLRPVGTTPKYDAIAPFVAGVMLTGMRLDEILSLQWSQVDLDALDSDQQKVGEIKLAGSGTKTKKARTVGLEVSPALHRLLSALKVRSGGKGSVFGITRGVADTAMKRLRDEYGAPAGFTFQALRRTCGTFLTNAPGIFGAASAYRSARQLGHSVKIAETHYLGLERGIARDARDLETAMQIGAQLERVIAQVGQPARPKLAVVS